MKNLWPRYHRPSWTCQDMGWYDFNWILKSFVSIELGWYDGAHVKIPSLFQLFLLSSPLSLPLSPLPSTPLLQFPPFLTPTPIPSPRDDGLRRQRQRARAPVVASSGEGGGRRGWHESNGGGLGQEGSRPREIQIHRPQPSLTTTNVMMVACTMVRTTTAPRGAGGQQRARVLAHFLFWIFFFWSKIFFHAAALGTTGKYGFTQTPVYMRVVQSPEYRFLSYEKKKHVVVHSNANCPSPDCLYYSSLLRAV